jgi:hypothetical protein
VAFTEDLSVFLDVEAGFAVVGTLGGDSIDLIFDAPGADALDGSVTTTEPSALVKAGVGIDVDDELVLGVGDLAEQLVHLAGTYTVRSVMPEPPDGVFVRAFLVKA